MSIAVLSIAINVTVASWSQETGNYESEPAKQLVNRQVTNSYSDSQSVKTKTLPKLFMNLAEDQKQIWTSPARMRLADATWLVPLGGLTAGLLVTDRDYSTSLSSSPSTINHYNKISNAGLASLVGAGAGMYLFSFPTHNEHWRETGWLAGEAAINSLLLTETFKYSLGRQRPFQNNGVGSFFQGGTSFPSEHAAAAWSVAGVIAHEYPGFLPKLFAYGAATAIDYSRIHGRQHFPSDVLVGSVLGYLVSQSIYTRRHEPALRGGAWEPPSEFVTAETRRSPAFMGSPYVPLDSWIYPAIERLIAFGYVSTASMGLRPWTRLECARLVSEAGERAAESDSPPQVQQLYSTLSQEFAYESGLAGGERNLHAQVESVYSRSLGISGTPLTDNYHFGQTILNDYGRPFEKGFNAIAGASGWTTAGPFVVYARGEYQSAPSAPPLSASALSFISTADGLPPNPPSTTVPAVGQFRLLDAYVGMTFSNWQISFGKQSLWWGPNEGGPMLFTDNAAPLNKMFRINRVSPFQLPWIFSHLGAIRTEFFLGQLSGQEFVNNGAFQTGLPLVGRYGTPLRSQPYLSGLKINFKMTPNFEVSLAKTTLYGGPGNPLTPSTLFKSILGLHARPSGTTGLEDTLGDGRSAMDFSYRVPRLRDWMTVYGEMFVEDEVTPLIFPRKSAFEGGVYLPKVPKLPHLDLRFEGGATTPVTFSSCNGCFYSNSQYVNGYTSNGELIGSWLGRAAQGELARSNYWFGPRSKVGFEFRHRKVDRQWLPGGGTQSDAALNFDFFAGSGFRFSGAVQYERWKLPLITTSTQSNVAASLQVAYWPSHHVRGGN